MRLAIPTWQRRVSPVFDTAQRLLIIDAADGSETARSEEDLRPVLPPQRVARLKELGVDVLICGAISRPLAGMIAASGIVVVPFIGGECDEVLAAYLDGRLPSPRFLMPGCCGPGRGWRHRGRGRAGRGFGAGPATGPGRRW
jgi:predicted Fe-Mo cluster-binding NifX family protein